MKKIQLSDDLFVLKLQKLYDVETYITKSLPKLIKKATREELKASLSLHLDETLVQCERLEKVFELLDVRPKKLKSETIRAIELDGSSVLEQLGSSALVDLAIIGTAREVEHYETALYLCAIADAEALGLNDIIALLEETLAEEEVTDEVLATLADSLSMEPDVAME